MRVQKNSADIGRCGCGRRDYCDGSHGLSEEQWQALQAKEQESARRQQAMDAQEPATQADCAPAMARAPEEAAWP